MDMDFFSQLFTELNSEDSITIIVFLAVAFLIGWMTGWLMGRRRANKANKLLRRQQELTGEATAEKQRLEEEVELREADLQRAELEVKDARTHVESLEAERNRLQSELYAAQEHAERLQTKAQAHEELIEDLNNQILGLKTRTGLQGDTDAAALGEGQFSATLERLQALETKLQSLEQDQQELNRLRLELEELDDTQQAEAYHKIQEKLEKLERDQAFLEPMNEKLRHLESEQSSLKSMAAKLQKLESENAHFQALQSKIEELESANSRMRQRLNRLASDNQEEEGAKGGVFGAPAAAAGFIDPAREEAILTQDSAEAKAALDRLLGVRLKRAQIEERDDLTQIQGIGPFIEAKLNSVGIFTFEQISQFDDELIEHVTRAIQFFPGRIHRDNWVGQAQELVQGS